MKALCRSVYVGIKTITKDKFRIMGVQYRKFTNTLGAINKHSVFLMNIGGYEPFIFRLIQFATE